MLILEQIDAVEAERDALFASKGDHAKSSPSPAAMLMTLKGSGAEFAGVGHDGVWAIAIGQAE